jgi:hypothetical protein
MTTNLGFGTAQAQPKTSKGAQERMKAAQHYETMKADGLPEYAIYIRIQGQKNWYPVGAIALKRSNQIHQAIFDSREQLLQGAYRLFPTLRKHQQQLEYGYRLKEFNDEPIQLAVAPPASRRNGVQAVFAQVQERVGALLKRN